jgi:hypothetical protein
MRLRALSIDRELRDVLLRGRVTGATFAVYDRVVYLRTIKGAMLVIAQMDVGNGPGFILLQHDDSLKSGHPSFYPGERFECEKGLVKIGEERIIVEAVRAATWDPSFAPTGTHRLGELETCLKIAREIAKSRARGVLGSLIGRLEERCSHGRQRQNPQISDTALVVHEKVYALAAALTRGCEIKVREAAQRIIGLGEGLTPSCDDLLVGLVGFLCGARRVPSLEAYARRMITRLGEVMKSPAERTTPVSAHFLSEAGRGRFAERVKELLEAIFAIDEKRVERASERVLEYGATSGVDLIYGMALGYEIAKTRLSLVARRLTQ